MAFCRWLGSCGGPQVNLMFHFQLLSTIVKNLRTAKVVVWCTPSVVERVRKLVPWRVQTTAPDIRSAEWLLVVGGGKLIDQAKLLRAEHPDLKLAALPTIWGSGAEVSPIAVWVESNRKVFRLDYSLRPDIVVVAPELSKSLSLEQIRWGCGDAWAHALEGFLSPLASKETRRNLAGIILGMLDVGLVNDPRWFELSAMACAGQATSSVGLVHGMAHTLEGKLGFGHARLCATLLWPVMLFNQSRSPKWPLLSQHGLTDGAIFAALAGFFNAEDYEKIREALPGDWKNVLRDPCTRTNSALLRPADLEFFVEFQP